MKLEIERKFLVPGPDWPGSDWRLPASGLRVVQGYLSRPGGPTVRVRRIGARGLITIKGRHEGIARIEFEYDIPAEEADQMLALCADAIVEKTRYEIWHGGFLWQIDEFHGANAGLVVAEIELAAPGQLIPLPDWVGREVTDDPRYRNSAMARHPFSTWPTPRPQDQRRMAAG